MRTSLLLSVLFAPALALAAPPPIQSRTLKNGLDVVVVENHALPLVTVEIAAKNGSMTESPEYNGLSHLYEHMFFKANKVIPSQEAYLARARELGMVWNGTTNTERVNYYFTTTADHLTDSMTFMRDAILSPLFDEKELERERVVVTGEIDRNESNPFYHFFHTVSQHVWWKFPSYKDPLGNRQTVLTATRAKMQTIQQCYYVPNNSVLMVTGDVKADDVFALAGQLYAGWKRAEDPFRKHPLVRHPPLKGTEVVLIEQPVRTVNGVLEWEGPSTAGKEIPLTYPADLLAFAVREPSSRMQRDLVDSGACVQVNFNWLTQMNVGPITMNFQAVPDKVDDCIKAILAELPKIKQDDYLSDQEIKDAVHSAEVQEALDREQPSQLAHTLTFWWTS